MERPRFVVFGDSITQRGFEPGQWVARLANTYQRKVDVINRGYSGYNSRWALHLLKRIFPIESRLSAPLLVTVFFGANDAALPDRTSARQHVPVEEYASNLHAIVRQVRAAGSPHVVLITPPPISEHHRLLWAKELLGEANAPKESERTNSVTKQYAEVCKQVGAEVGVPVLDLWSLMQGEAGWQDGMLCDGLHLTAEGGRFVHEQLVALIERDIPDLRADDLAFDFPLHAEINHTTPGAAFSSS